jgi:AraC-like DNA-binding protein
LPFDPLPVWGWNEMAYRIAMRRKQVLVQLDDDLVKQLDLLATSLEVSRSELLRRGAQAIVSAAGDWTADRRLEDAYRRLPPDASLAEAVGRLAAKVGPPW